MATTGVTATTAVVRALHLNSQGGVIVSLEVAFTVTDSGGNTYSAVREFPLNSTQQQALSNFVSNIQTALSTATGLTVTFQ